MKLKSIVVSGLLASMITACGKQTSVEEYLIEANSYIENKEFASAEISLKNALKQDLSSPSVRLLLGQVYLQQGESVSAIKELERALELGAAESDVVPSLARAYILNEDDAAAMELARHKPKLSDLAKVSFLLYDTIASVRNQDITRGLQNIEEAKKTSASEPSILIAEAYTAFAEQNLPLANELLEQAEALNPNDPEALMLAGHLAFAQSNFEDAVTNYQRFQELQPRFPLVSFHLMRSLIKAERYDEAEAIADQMLAGVPNQPFALYIKALARFQAKDYQEAASTAEMSLSNGFNQIDLQMVAGASAFYLNNYEQSYNRLNAIKGNLPKDHAAMKMLAVSQLNLGYIDDLAESFDLSDSQDEDFWSSVSYRLVEIGAFDEANELNEKLVNKSPDSALELTKSGLIKLLKSDASGEEDLEAALQLDSSFNQAKQILAYQALKGGDIAKAQEIVNGWLTQEPKNAEALVLKALVLTERDKFDEAQAVYDEVLELNADNVTAKVQMIKLKYAAGDIEGAKSYAKNSFKQHPKNMSIMRHYFILHDGEGSLDELKAVFQNDNRLTVAMLLAEKQIKEELYSEAVATLNRFNPMISYPKQYWQLQLLALDRLEDKAQFENTLNKWTSVNPYHVEPFVFLGKFYAEQGQYEKALDVVTRGTGQHQGAFTLNVMRLELLIVNRNTIDARLHFNHVEPMLDERVANDFNGRIFLLERKFDQAIPLLENSYQRSGSSRNIINLAIAHSANKDTATSIEVLEGHIAKNSDDIKARNLLANFYLQKSPNKALAQYEKIMEHNPKNFIVSNNLSYLYMEENNLEKALQYSTQAVEIAPKVPDVNDTHSQVLKKLGQNKEALKFAKVAFDGSQGRSPEISLNYAELLIISEDFDNAGNVLNGVKAQTPAQNKLKDALEKRLQ